MNQESEKEILLEHYYRLYNNFRNKQILKYANLKLGVGLLIIIYFGFLDILIQENHFILLLRCIPAILIILFFILQQTQFKKDIRHVNFFYNAFLISLSVMMYGKAYIDVNTGYFTSSIVGTILVLCIIGLELRSKLRTTVLIFIIPVLVFVIALLISGKYSEIPFVDLSHIFGIIILAIMINHVQETLRYKGFIDNKKLEIEKNKSEALYQNVLEQKEEIQAQKEEIESQRDIAEIQRDEIINQKNEITSSIEYAKRIQMAIFPREKQFKNSFKDYFILYRPKDIVSGDFYWINKVNDWTLFALADCTGHGVPGAFMSMLGITILNELTGKRRLTDVDIILNELRTEIITSLHQKDTFGETKDGMDITICAYNKEQNILHFAGANNSMLIIRSNNNKNEIIEFKGEKMPISIYRRLDPFVKHEIQIHEGDSLYLYSDGYADQFGGEKSKKFKMKPFKELLLNISNQPMIDQHNQLNANLETWMKYNLEQGGVNEQNDDISVLGIKF